MNCTSGLLPNSFRVLIDRLYALGSVRRFLWRHWYPLLTRMLKREEVLFLNYACAEQQQIPLSAADEPNRACIHLYHKAAAQVPLSGKDVLEVSCGHGGGASYLMRTFGPKRYTGLDFNPDGIRFCQRRHHLEGLAFVRGDAENLPFAAASMDVVINIEASHCYGSFTRFLGEVARVLRPSGHLLYADFRPAADVPLWQASIQDSPFQIIAEEDITSAVVRGMQLNSARSEALVSRFLPRFLQTFGRDFAGVRGSRMYNDFERRDHIYRLYCLRRR